MRDDLEQEVGGRQRGFDRGKVGLFVLVAHRANGNPQWTIVERADESVDFCLESGFSELLGKAPELATARDWGMIVEKHAVGVATLAAFERNGNDLSALCVVAEPG